MQDWVFRLELEVDCLSLKNVSKLWRNRSRNLSWPSPFSQLTNYGHTMAKFLIFCSPFQIPIKNRYLGFVCKGLVFRRNNGWIIENTDKGLTVQNWVLIYWPKIFQMAQNFLPKQKVWDWASVVRVTTWTHRLFIVMALSVFCWYNYLMYREFFKVGVI